MTTAISKALDEVRFRIPRPILEAVFIDRDLRFRQTPTSINEHIMNEVIRPRVMVDCNLVGGVEVMIPLEGIPSVQTNDYTTVYRIPKSETQNRSIISVLNITFNDPYKVPAYGGVSNFNRSSMLQVGSAVMDAMGSSPMASTARVQLIGENVVMVSDTIRLPPNIYLRCILANDENMSHLQLKSYRHFANLVVFAVKSYIYNEYIIRMDMAELYGGQQLGRFKEIIDGYADSEELYQTYLTEKMGKVLLMNDRPQMERLLKLMIGGNR